MKTNFYGLAMAALCLSASVSSAAHNGAGIEALRLQATEPAVQIDGHLDEAAWQRAPLFDRFVQFEPTDKQPARWRSSVRVLLTDDALVFGIRAYDPAPALIRAPLSRRDKVARDQDFVSVVLDPVGQRRSAQFARVSAAGVLADGLFSADDDSEDFAPDFELQAAAQILPDGYSVELRWPLAALRFPYTDGAPWLLMVTRNTPRETSRLDVSAPLTKSALNFITELQPLAGLHDLVEQVRERSFLSIRPELTARKARETHPSDASARSEQNAWALGAELKWRPRADWVIDATFNPDFSQVELDTPQLAGNTRFALSVPEKRAFFLESTDVVGQSQSDGAQEQQSLAAFYSRAIADPDWGLRATWRGATAEATVLSLRDAGGGEIRRAGAFGTRSYAQNGRSLASFARGRMQLSVWGQALGLGLLASQREHGKGAVNTVLGSDFAATVGASDLLRGHLLASSTTAGFDAEGQLTRVQAENGHKVWLEWRRRSEAWNNSAQYEESSARFANDNGFVSQTGIRRATLHLSRRLHAQTLAIADWAALEADELELQFKAMQAQTLSDPRLGVRAGELVERQLQPGFWFLAARNTNVWGHLGLDQQRARSGGLLHQPRTVNLGFESNPNAWLTLLGAELSWGRRLDVDADRLGRGASLTLQAKLRSPLPWGWWLELEQQVGQSHVRNALGQRSFTEANAQTLAVLHLSARDSVRAIMQRTRYQRQPEPGLLAADESTRHLSLVFQHRQGLSRVFSLGLVSALERPSQRLNTELFAKAAFAVQP